MKTDEELHHSWSVKGLGRNLSTISPGTAELGAGRTASGHTHGPSHIRRRITGITTCIETSTTKVRIYQTRGRELQEGTGSVGVDAQEASAPHAALVGSPMVAHIPTNLDLDSLWR